MKKDDQEIVKGLCSGNQKNINEAYRKLFRRYYKELVNYLRKRYSGLIAPGPEELVDDVFLSLYEFVQKQEVTRSLKALLFKMVKNRAHKEVRKKGPQLVSIHGKDLAPPGSPLNESENSGEAFEELASIPEYLTEPDTELREILIDLMDKDEHKGCSERVTLFYFRGFTHEEIKNEMGDKNIATSKNLIARCKRYLYHTAKKLPGVLEALLQYKID